MKRYSLFSGIRWAAALCLLLTARLYAQDDCIAENATLAEACCNDFIATDSASAWNPARPDLRNRFEWRNPKWKVYIPTPGSGYTLGGSQPFLMDNPFFTRNAQLSHLNFAPYPSSFEDIDSLDFHPEDGWELLHKYDGFDSLGTSYLYGTSAPSRPGPYVMLYNRYTGRLRIFASFEGIDPQTDLMETELRFKTPENPSIKPTTLMMKENNIAQPLSEKTSVARASAISKATSTSEFFTAAFDLAYDPCICLNYSEIEFKFGVIDTALINLSGRLVGTSQVVNTNGSSPLLNNQEFLTSVYKNGLDVEAGAITYKNINGLVTKYKAKPGLSPFAQTALGIVGSIIKAGIGSTDKWLTGVVDGKLTKGVKELGLVGDTAKVKTGLKLFGDQTDRILVSMGLKSAPIRTPGASVIEAEMAMTGVIANNGSIGGNSSIILRTPGSLGTDSVANSPWFYYPSYNEPLGVMAVLDSPIVRRTIAQSRSLYPHEPNYETPGSGSFVYSSSVGPYVRYNFDHLSFVFNPAAEVDEEKTVILAALVVKGPPANYTLEEYDYFEDVSNIYVFPSEVNIDESNTDYYVSPFLSLECLKDYVVGDFAPGAEVYLRLMIQYVFKENDFGKVNQAFEILTYPVKFIVSGLPPYTYMPDTIVVDGSTTFTQNTTLKARNAILVTGGVTLSPGVTVTLAAGSEVVVNPGVTLPPNMMIEVGVEAILGCDYPTISQVPVDTVQSFCNSSRYQANQLSNKVSTVTPVDEIELDDISALEFPFSLTAFPNPFDETLTLRYELPEAAQVSIVLIDMMGRPVLEIQRTEAMKAGPQEITVDASQLASGLYHAVLQTGDRREAVKVVKE